MKHGTLTRAVLAALKRLNRGTVAEIADNLNLPRKPVGQALTTIHDAGMSHICDWQPDAKGRYARVYRYGDGVNVSKAQAHGYSAERSLSRDSFSHKIKKTFDNVGRCDVAASWIKSGEMYV